jgi:hypothetical protein
MNLLKTIIERLNQRVEVANIFDKQFGLCELNANGNDKAWVHYIGNGQAEVVTNFDAKQGTLFWAKRGKVTVVKTDAYKMSGCKQLYVTSFPLTAYAVVRKSHLPCDGDDAQDWLASRIYKLTSGTDPQFKQNLGVINYEVIPSGYINEIKSLTANYEFACVTVDFDIQVITTTEDGCYDICSTGDIPLPDFQPCTPCLTEVAVDGVTIIGNGTEADPLIAVGGGGGTPLITKNEGTNVSTNTSTLNFTGAGVTASLTSPGVVEVNVPGGGGAVGTLQEVTDLGNSTTNDIAFTASAGLSFDNGAFFRKGTTDAGNGGAKGTSQICSISYELKWEAGRLYYMQQDGFTIRDVTHNFTFVPQVTDDSTKGFVVGSRWSLDDGTVYLCSDDTIGAAVWAVVAVGGVTSVSGTAPIASTGGATPDISITQADGSTDGYLSSTDWNTFDGKFDVPTGTNTDYLDGTGTPTAFPAVPPAQVNSDWNAVSGVAEILNKPTIPAAQVNSDWNATSGVAEILNKPTIPVVTGFVPYTGATNDVNLGTHTLSAKDLVINHPSGSGVAASITKGGSGEALTVVKSSGSGNAASITGGVTLIDELHLTTDLADAYIASAATWNAKQDALSSGVNIKTINSTSLLGAGNITIASLGVYKSTTDGAVSSGTANTFSQSVLVPGNSVTLGSVLEFKIRGRKTGANAVYTIRLYANTTNNLSGSPVLLATYTGTLTQALALQMTRTAAVKNATTNTEMLLATTTNAPNDNTNTTFAAIAIDWTSDKYIIGAVQNANATDSSLISLISMTII